MASELGCLGPSEAALEPQVSTESHPSLCRFYLVTVFKMLNSKPASLSQSCIVVMVFKAELSLCLFLQETVSKAKSALASARPGEQGHGAKPTARSWRVHKGVAEVTGSGRLGLWLFTNSSSCSQRRSLSWKGGRHLFRLFLHQVLLTPELPHVSQTDFKTHLVAEPL